MQDQGLAKNAVEEEKKELSTAEKAGGVKKPSAAEIAVDVKKPRVAVEA